MIVVPRFAGCSEGVPALANASITQPPNAATELLQIDEVPAPVLLPALLIRFGTERFFLAVADRLDMVSGYPALH